GTLSPDGNVIHFMVASSFSGAAVLPLGLRSAVHVGWVKGRVFSGPRPNERVASQCWVALRLTQPTPIPLYASPPSTVVSASRIAFCRGAASTFLPVRSVT